jgi:hypothetical protein
LNDASQWLAVGPGYTTSTFVPNDMEAAVFVFESKWHSAFPKAALMASTVASPSAPQGTFTGINDTFNSDMFSYDLSNYPHVMEEMNSALGWSASGSNIYTAGYLPTSKQPQLGIAYQLATIESSVSSAHCASGGLYSTNDTQCVTPSVYAGLAHMMYPYMEFYISDWRNAKVQPWIKLIHDVTYGQ